MKTEVEIQLIGYWSELVNTLEINDKLAKKYWNSLIQCYRGKNRFYHNLNHLVQLMSMLEKAEGVSTITTIATFYHDVIYRPGSSMNEKKSAERCRNDLVEMGVSETIIQSAREMILATRHHIPNSKDMELFLDADMSILGSNSNTYLDYQRAVRKEHHHLPECLYDRGRWRFLQALLGSNRIFLSNYFFKTLESQARENLSREMRGISNKYSKNFLLCKLIKP